MSTTIRRAAFCLALFFCLHHHAAAEEAAAGSGETVSGMSRLSYMIGEWEVVSIDQHEEVQYRASSTIRPTLDGRALAEKTTATWDGKQWEVQIYRAYDRFQEQYRMAILDNYTGLLDIYEGRFDGALLHQSNLDSGTYVQTEEGQKLFFRGTTERISEDHFIIRGDYSADQGRTWAPAGRYEYRRKK